MSDTVTNDNPATEPGTNPATQDDTDVLFRDEADDLDGEMPTRAKRRVVTVWTMVFAALVLAGLGFVAGIQMEKRDAPAATGLPPGLAAFANARANGTFAGFTGRANAASGGNAAGGNAATGASQTPASNGATGNAAVSGTTGSVKLVDGTNVYITTSDGSIVKVTTSAASKVTKAAPGAVSDLKAGDTITVQGATGADGTIAATSISQTP